MKNLILKALSVFFIGIVFLGILINPVGAQTPTATPTAQSVSTLPPTPATTPALPDITNLAGSDVVTFSQFGEGEIQLDGPYDSTRLYFTLPADWALKGNIQLVLFVGVSFNTGVQNQGDIIIINGGVLTILLNDTVLQAVPLNQVGETQISISLPASLASSSEELSLRFVLDSGASCRIVGSQTTVYIHPASYFSFPHDIVQPSTSLLNFPRPIIQNSFTPDAALLVIPDKPTSAELQAALTVAAGLGRMNDQLVLDMVTISGLREEQTKQHLIFIGKAGSLPLLESLKLPLPSIGGQFQVGGEDDGLIEMVNSPWNISRVALVVSANTDVGVVKAAQAISSGVIRPNQAENFAVIEQVNTLPISSLQAIDQTLSDLGYGNSTFQSRGAGGQDYVFNVPPGMTVSTDAYFNLVYGHSSLLDYNVSQIVVLLNNQPIGSVRMSDSTAASPTNNAKIMIPPLAVLPGVNRLSVRVNLESPNNCTPPNSTGLWITIWPQSLIHLPLITSSLDPLISRDLAAFPAPFSYDTNLSSTAFILERDGLESWRSAMKIAVFLGGSANGTLIQLSAFYGDQMALDVRSKYHLLLVGRPSKLPVVSEINNDLPAPFQSGSDEVSESGNFQVIYRIPLDSPMGYIETMLSPWNSKNTVFAILGNTAQGVTWAADSLLSSDLRSQLRGNFAEINDKQVISSTGRYLAADSGAVPVVEVPAVIATPSSGLATNQPTTRSPWISPVIIVSISLIIIVIIIVVFQNWIRWNTRKKGEKAQANSSNDAKQSETTHKK